MLSLYGDDVAQVGGFVGILAAALAIFNAAYTALDKWRAGRLAAQKQEQEMRENEMKTALVTREQEVTVEALANTKVAEAYDRLAAERKAAHDRDVKYLTEQIEVNRKRLSDLEAQRDKEAERCREDTAALRKQNSEQAEEIAERAREIRELRAVIADLEFKLKQTGALPPGTGLHVPVNG